MNITELESFNLDDAIQFNTQLNPALWEKNKLKPEIREQLLKIADDFREFLGVPDLAVRDITISGSNASYSYTSKSDIDLHLVADIPRLDNEELYKELFSAKKYQYNTQHNITIKGHSVELYVQNPAEKHHSQGIYSVLNDDWVSIPKKRKADVDDLSVRAKYETLVPQIEKAIKTNSVEAITTLADRIRDLRRAGLEQGGEFSPENLVFKMLRNQGYIDRLYRAKSAAKDDTLSLEHITSKKDKSPGSYGWVGDAVAEDDNNAVDSDVLSRVDDKIQSVPVGKMIQDIASQMYPNATFTLEDDESVTTDDGFFVLALPGAEVVDGTLYVGPIIFDAHTQQYKGVLSKAFPLIIERIKKAAGTGKPAIIVELDQSLGVWEGMAKKLGVKLINTSLLGETSEPKTTANVSKIASNFRQWVKSKYPNVDADAYAATHGGLVVSKIEVPKEHRKAGIATAIMKELARIGDENNTVISLTPTNEFGSSKAKLIDFYKRFDFVLNKGRNKDFTVSELMYRAPKTQVAEGVGRITSQNQTKDVGPNEIAIQAKKFGNDVNIDGYPKYKMTDKNIIAEADVDVTNLSPQVRRMLRRSKVKFPYAKSDLEAFLSLVHKNVGDARSKINVVDFENQQQQVEINDLEYEFTQMEKQELVALRRDINQLVRHNQEQDQIISSLTQQTRESLEKDWESWKQDKLVEANMSPGVLSKWAAANAQNIVMGFEAELIFPNQLNSQEIEDERVEDFGDFYLWYENNGGILYPRDTNSINDDFEEFRSEYFEEQLEDYTPDDDDYRNMRFFELVDKKFNKSYTDELTDEEEEEINAEIEDEISNQHRIYSDWYNSQIENARDEIEGNTRDSDLVTEYFSERGFRYASDIVSYFSFDMPRNETEEHYSEEAAQSIADYIESEMGVDVIVSGEYHGTTKNNTSWYIEPDGSIEPSDDTDLALEIVSPPMPFPEAISAMKELFSTLGYNATTNHSTGFHMSMSIPNMENVDYIKLILFLGDRYVLDSFDRLRNSYAKAITQAVDDERAKGNYIVRTKMLPRSTGLEILAELRKGLSNWASGILDQTGDRYSVVSVREGYMELRAAGNQEYHRNIDQLINTANRYAFAMSVAADPNAYKEEYYKKLYKMLAYNIEPEYTDAISLFAEYTSGKTDLSGLKQKYNMFRNKEAILAAENAKKQQFIAGLKQAINIHVKDPEFNEILTSAVNQYADKNISDIYGSFIRAAAMLLRYKNSDPSRGGDFTRDTVKILNFNAEELIKQVNAQ